MRTLGTFVACALVAGCATTQPVAAPSSAAPPAAAAPGDDAAANVSTAPPGRAPRPDGPPGIISRRDLAAVLDQSPGYFLQHVQTEPHFQRGRFHGWRLVSFFPGDARFAGVDLQAGDVVTRINGHSIEHPDEFMAVWTELKSSHELTVDVERDGAPRTLRWTIADK